MVVTVTLAWALLPLAETFTWKVPVPLFGAVYSPVPLIVPPPLTCQANVGCESIALPNWSRAVAVNCCVAPWASVTLAGVMLSEVHVGTTVTVRLPVVARPSESLTVKVKV